MADVCARLQDPSFRFVLLGSSGEALKKPFEKAWQETANYPYTDTRLSSHRGNIGVCGGFGDLLILDSDDLPRWEELGILDMLPSTFTIESRPGHRQFYMRCSEPIQSGSLYDPEQTDTNGYYIHIGDIKGTGGQAVTPGSRHPSGSTYQIVFDAPIAEVSPEHLRSIIKKFSQSKKPSRIEQNTAKLENMAATARQNRAETDEARTRRWADAALGDEVLTLAGTSEGDRNNQLFKSTACLAEFVAAGLLDENMVISELTRASENTGLDSEEIARTIRSGLDAGKQHPRKIPEREEPKVDAPSAEGARPRACIKLCGDLLKNEEEVLEALYAYNSPPTIYQRGGSLSRIKQVSEDRYKIEDLTDYALRNEMSRAATFQKFKLKKETDGDKDEFDEKKTKWTAIPCEPPINLVRGIMALDAWDVPYINGLIGAPVIRPDGSLLLEPGFDEATGLCYKPDPALALPRVPEHPTKEDAINAATFVMDEVLHDFPFVDDASKAGALAAFLTPVIRPMIKGCVPMALVDKPAPGTGASKLLDLISIVATGRPMAALSPPGDEEEWRKLITGLMRDGAGLVCIDNIASDLKADALSRALSSTIWKDRTLGKPDAVEYPQRSSWYSTGNNLTLSGDIPRRSHLIQLDAKMARPWERTTFKHANINAWVEANRGAILGALLTMVRAWVIAGRPNGCKTIIGGFDEWVKNVGGVLSYAGISGFLDNLPRLYEEVDSGSEEWGEFFQVWFEWHATGVSSNDVLDQVSNPHTSLGKCTPSELAEKIKYRGPGDAKKVGLALRKKLNVRYKNGFMLNLEIDKHSKQRLWKVEKVQDPNQMSIT